MSGDWRMNGVTVPEGYETVPHQVAGHMFQDGKIGMLRVRGDTNGRVLKPVQCPPKGQRELDFYKAVFDHPSPSPGLLSFRPWLPKFDGIVDLPNKQRYMRLEDLAAPFESANVMDVKIGRRCWDNCATEEKIHAELTKYPLQATLGYRVGGLRLYNEEKDSFTFYSKSHCLSLDKREVTGVLQKFFGTCREDLQDVLTQLGELLSLFEEQQDVHFFSSSLLIIRECCSMSQRRACVRMIDFAHAFILSDEESSSDDNYLYGLRNLISDLSELL